MCYKVCRASVCGLGRNEDLVYIRARPSKQAKQKKKDNGKQRGSGEFRYMRPNQNADEAPANQPKKFILFRGSKLQADQKFEARNKADTIWSSSFFCRRGHWGLPLWRGSAT